MHQIGLNKILMCSFFLLFLKTYIQENYFSLIIVFTQIN